MTSTVLTSTANARPISGELAGVVLAAGSADATVKIYDSATTTTTKQILSLAALAKTSVVVTPPTSLVVGAGVYAVISGTEAEVTILIP